ncbi:hypothetical protein AgCh_032937 [Apium graveolens]
MGFKEKWSNGLGKCGTKSSFSSGTSNIPNATFSNVVSGVLDILKKNQDAYQRELDEEQLESLAEPGDLEINLEELNSHN